MLYPLVSASPERQRLSAFSGSLSFQIVSKERCEDVFPVVGGGWTTEIDAPQLAAVAPGPAAMIPWTNHEEVLFRSVVTLEQLVDLDWTVEVFLIPPAGHVQDRHRDLVQPRRKRLAFPKHIVVRLSNEVGPCRQLALKILCVRIRERAEFQVPVVRIEVIDNRVNVRDLFRRLHHVGIFKTVAQTKSAVVVKVVPEPHVGG